MSSSTARIVLKRGSASLFGSSSSRQQPRLAFRGFRRLIPNSSNSSSSPSFLYNNRRGQVLHISQLVKSRAFSVDILALAKRLEMQKSLMTQDASLSEFNTEVQSSQEHHFSLLQRETEKFRGDIENMRSETPADIEKLRKETLAEIAKTRSDLRNEICENNSLVHALRDETCRDKSLVLQEIQAYRAQVEAATDQAMKFYFGALISIFVTELVIIRLM